MRTWASWRIATIVASPIWEKGAEGAGFCFACVNSFMAMAALSIDDGNGRSQWCGKTSMMATIIV